MSQPPEKGRRPRQGRQRRSLAWAVASGVLVLDQGTKAWALQQLPSGLAQPFLPGLLQLRLVHNTGAAFSLLTGSTPLLALVSLVVCVALALLLWRRPPQTMPLSLALGLLLGGAAGNGLDRWRLGSVTDFLELVPISFPVFNLADVAINLAVLCFLIDAMAGLGQEGGRDG
jgi:signal peptidase II